MARIFGAPETVPAGIHVHRARTRHAAHVVAAEVDEHHVLGALFQVGEQLLLEPRVLGGIGATPSRPGERPRLHAPALDLHELFRRRAHHVPVAA
ncbi:MAG: hypothetical protein PVSMB5_38610 [Ktedonobacteraceae bacterium]